MNKPAFPQSREWQNDYEQAANNPGQFGFPSQFGTGLSIRDYFIAHAPTEPQLWFEPIVDTPADMEPIAAQNEYMKQRYIQWPAAWADAMLAQRAKGE